VANSTVHSICRTERFGHLSDRMSGRGERSTASRSSKVRSASATVLSATDRIAAVLDQGPTSWCVPAGRRAAGSMRGEPLDLIASCASVRPCVNRSAILIARKGGAPLTLVSSPSRSPQGCRRGAPQSTPGGAREGLKSRQRPLVQLDWVILVTSLSVEEFAPQTCGSLSAAMAYRTRLQTLEEPDRPQRATRFRTSAPQTLRAGPSSHHPFARARLDEFEDSPPRAGRRLTRPGAWRVLKQLFATLLQP